MVGLKPKPKFMGLFQFMGAKSKTPMRLENNNSEPDEGSELSLTGWWRLGREPVSEGRICSNAAQSVCLGPLRRARESGIGSKLEWAMAH